MEYMSEIQAESPWYIFIIGGDRMYLLGDDGRYLTEYYKDAALNFTEKIDAIKYVEKRGLQRLATIRRASACSINEYISNELQTKKEGG